MVSIPEGWVRLTSRPFSSESCFFFPSTQSFDNVECCRCKIPRDARNFPRWLTPRRRFRTESNKSIFGIFWRHFFVHSSNFSKKKGWNWTRNFIAVKNIRQIQWSEWLQSVKTFWVTTGVWYLWQTCVVTCFGCQNNLVPENKLKKRRLQNIGKKNAAICGWVCFPSSEFSWEKPLWQDMVVAFMEQCREGVRDVWGPWWTCRAALDVYTLGYFPFQVIVTTGSTTCLVGASFVTITEKRYNPIHLKKSKFEARTVTRATMYNRTRNSKKHRTLPKTRKLTWQPGTITIIFKRRYIFVHACFPASHVSFRGGK